MKVSLISTVIASTLLAPIAFASTSTSALDNSQVDRFANAEVTIPHLSHSYYLGEDSKADHFWHGEDDGRISFKATGGNDAVVALGSNFIHPDLNAHSEKFEKGIYTIGDNMYQLWGYGLTTPVIVEGDDGIIVLDPMESADKMRDAIEVFRAETGIDKPVTGIVYSHWHMDHFGGVRGLDNISDDVKIIVHDTFMKNVINNTMGGLGPAIGFRVDYSLGTLIQAEETGRINGGLGPDFLVKELTLIRPNTEVEGHWGTLDIEISGVKMHVAHIPSESADEIVAYFPEENILWGAEVVQGESFPNLHTIRGTRYRDPQNWYPGIDVLRGFDADIYLGAHNRPINGAAHVEDTLTAYRDAIQFTYDQSIKAINNGSTGEDLIRDITLPAHLEGHPFLGDFYGSIRHAAKQVFTGELGWFDGDPTTLNPIHSSEASVRYVEMVGGVDNMMEFAMDAAKSGDYQWAAELATHAIRVDTEDMGPRDFKAEMMRELAYAETNNNWRNWYLTAAVELDGTIDRSLKFPMSAPDLFETYSEGQLVGAMRFNLSAERTANDHYTIAFNFGETQHALEVRRGVAQFHEDFSGDAKATVNISRELFIGVLLGQVDFVESAQAGLITVDGDAATVPTFFGSLDKPTNEPILVTR
ncbi:MBL fold metallo-hydrolase [Vibrio kyushuensis]|uniref:alkyl sulfatase dimerization domain-containing protein n=1 Tax=Vibrio kyushuensis TaxID=2910249 RepID=UPI003D1351D0